MIGLIVWAAFGALTWHIAKKKNRNEWLWLVLGLLFGIFALIAIAILKKVDDPTQVELIAGE